MPRANVDIRTVAELLARYDLEPDLRDVYVEGPSDRVLCEMALEHAGRGDIKVYEIDTVEVLGSGSGGNKGRLVMLARELEASSKRDLIGSVACVVDQDLDGVLKRRITARLLIYSCGSSLDIVLVQVRVLDKLLRVVLLGFPIQSKAFLKELLPVINEHFLHRLANEAMSLGLSHLEVCRMCEFDGVSVRFDSEDYLKRYLGKSAQLGRLEEFKQAIEGHRPVLATMPDHCVHVDDFIELLQFCVRRIKPKLVPADLGRFRRLLFGLLEADWLLELGEVQEVLRRLQPA
jgi:hypothetical protein